MTPTEKNVFESPDPQAGVIQVQDAANRLGFPFFRFGNGIYNSKTGHIISVETWKGITKDIERPTREISTHTELRCQFPNLDDAGITEEAFRAFRDVLEKVRIYAYHRLHSSKNDEELNKILAQLPEWARWRTMPLASPKPTWRNTFNGDANRGLWKSLATVHDAAAGAGYDFVAWHDTVYRTNDPKPLMTTDQVE